MRSQQDDDARVADAQRFVAGVEDMVARLQPGDAPARVDRIRGPDRTGTAHATVDPVGRLVDIGLTRDWWPALGPSGVAAGLLEALACARMKAALVPLILRRYGVGPATGPVLRPAGVPFVDTARARLADAYRLIDHAGQRTPEHSIRVIAGPRGLFRLHVRGSRIEGADVDQAGLSAGDTDRLVADARDALTELARDRVAVLDGWAER
jgi:hypothetical protein